MELSPFLGNFCHLSLHRNVKYLIVMIVSVAYFLLFCNSKYLGGL